jgi:aminomethyltransferase
MKRTPFFCDELAAGATMRNFLGWEMPADFGDPRAEHLAVRNSVGTFDWASTGEIEVSGPDALALLQKVIVNDASKLAIGTVLYTTLCHLDGTIFSDVTIYRLGDARYWVMTAWGNNRDNQRPEFDWLVANMQGFDVSVTDVSSGVAILAVQGPRSREVVSRVSSAAVTDLRYMRFMPTMIAGAPQAMISRTGYTGELGFELIVPSEYAHDAWEAVQAAGREFNLQPAGMTTAFSLRMEKGYIARFDFIDSVTPWEANLGWTVKFGKGDFIGREALLRQKEEGIKRQLVTVALEGEVLPAGGCTILHNGSAVGKTTSSAFGHSMHCPLALAVVQLEAAQPGTALEVETEGKLHPAQIVPRPYYDPEGTHLRS